MKARRTVGLLAVALLTALSVPNATQGQDRTRGVLERTRERLREAGEVLAGAISQVPRARVGISLDVRQSRRFDDQGALITDVLEGSPAWEAGIREGDIVTSFRGHVLTAPLEEELEKTFDERDALPVQRLLALAREMEPEEIVEIRYMSDGETHTVEVEAEAASRVSGGGSVAPGRLGAFFRGGDRNDPDAWGGAVAVGPGGAWFGGALGECPGGSNRFWSAGGGRGCVAGVEFRELNPSLGEYFGTETGILVIDVDDDNPLGLMPGDVVLSVGDREVSDLNRLQRVLGSYDQDETVTLKIIRKGDEETLRGTLH